MVREKGEAWEARVGDWWVSNEQQEDVAASEAGRWQD